jgi:hypothetical protein
MGAGNPESIDVIKLSRKIPTTQMHSQRHISYDCPMLRHNVHIVFGPILPNAVIHQVHPILPVVCSTLLTRSPSLQLIT